MPALDLSGVVAVVKRGSTKRCCGSAQDRAGPDHPEALGLAGTALVTGYGAYLCLKGQLSVGELIVVIAYLAAVYKPLEPISNTVSACRRSSSRCEVAFELLDTQPDIQERPDATAISGRAGRVDFEDVAFSYAGRTDTLKASRFEAGPGRWSRSSARPGRQEHAGQPDPAVLRRRRRARPARRPRRARRTLGRSAQQISIVLQEPLLFSGTIADNIRYGRLDAHRPKEVIEAARAATRTTSSSRCPRGTRRELGERGAKLSGGERQRIAVARAFLKDAPILILDEPTSSIDSKTEAVILDALDRLMEGRTTFMIAHRLSTIRRADLILVMDHGRIVEQGTHEELLARGGLYRQLHEMQTGRATAETAATRARRRDSADAVTARAVGDSREPAMNVPRPKKIVLLGMMTQMPVAGSRLADAALPARLPPARLRRVLRRGARPHARRCSCSATAGRRLGRAAAFIDGVMRRFGLRRPLGLPRTARRRPLLRHERGAAQASCTARPR